MGAIQIPVPAMRGWNVETRRRSFNLLGPGGSEFDDREALPFVKTSEGWWVSAEHLHGVCASLELVQANLDRFWGAVIREKDAVSPGDGSGPDRKVQLGWGSAPTAARPGMVFTGLPEHAWVSPRLRSLEFTYAELDRLLLQAHQLHDPCDCDRPRRGPILTETDLAEWRMDCDTKTMYYTMLIRLKRGHLWPPGSTLPSAEQIPVALKTLTVPPEPGATALALTRLTAEGHLHGTGNPPGPPYTVPHHLPTPATVPAARKRPLRAGSKAAAVYDYVTEGITVGVWDRETKLPTQKKISTHCDTTQNTVSRVMAMLVEDGWVEQRGPKGAYFPAATPPRGPQ